MVKETVEALVEGGKASGGPPLGPALGPKGVNIGEVVAEINKKTADFKGMQVPVKVTIDTDTKEFKITIGTPPASALIKQEAQIPKGASNPLTEKYADLKIEQIMKIAKMKQSNLLGVDNFSIVKEIIGTCQSMGILVEGKPAHETIEDINKGMFAEKIKSGKTELSADELKEQEEERHKLQEEIEKRREEFETKAKEILSSMQGKPNKEIRQKMADEEIPEMIINEVAPEEKAEEGAAAKPEAKPEEKKK